MKDRIISFLKNENLSPSQFADLVGVQRSNISHIISGRNKPGFDFIEKMLKAFPMLNAEWLIMGTGPIYKEARDQFIFPQGQLNLLSVTQEEPNSDDNSTNEPENKDITEHPPMVENKESQKEIIAPPVDKTKEVEKIIICYSDNSFDIYFPKQ